MKKYLFSMLALLAFAFWGCSLDEDCNNLSNAETRYFWCPKMDSVVVDWMSSLEEHVYYDSLADCERFENGYKPQHELLRQCENDTVMGKLLLHPYTRYGSYKEDSNVVSIWVSVHVDEDPNAVQLVRFNEKVEAVAFYLYGCTAFSCRDAAKLHVYAEKDKSFDMWLSPENFKIVETGSKPSGDYYRYHHFNLIVDSPIMKTTIEVRCDSNCYDSMNSHVPQIGG